MTAHEAEFLVKIDQRQNITFEFLPDIVSDIERFHQKFELMYNDKPRLLEGELGDFREKFMEEELREYSDQRTIALKALDDNDPATMANALEGMLDALVDLVYVAVGTAYLHGFDFREAWKRVHEANMRKVRAQAASDSKRGTTFDVVKPAGWTPPTHRDLVIEHAHWPTDE
jgi:predicted HAD superfamily Cof-like phosphohydrolase